MTDLAPALQDVIAERIRHFRRHNGWSRRQLADVCAELGAKQVTEQVLVNLEREPSPRPRRRLTVDEWLVIAVALRVPPTALLIPASTAPSVELLPGYPMSTPDALLWLEGRVEEPWEDTELGLVHPGTPYPGEHPQLALAVRTLWLLRDHGECVGHLEEMLAIGEMHNDFGEPAPRPARQLIAIRTELEGRGDALPDVSPEVAEILVQAERHIRLEEPEPRGRRRPLPARSPEAPRFTPELAGHGNE